MKFGFDWPSSFWGLKSFPYMSVKQVIPGVGPFLTPGLVVHKIKLQTKYQRPGPSTFREEDFLKFGLQEYVKNLTIL